MNNKTKLRDVDVEMSHA